MINMEALFFPNENRNKLFIGKIFVFLCKGQVCKQFCDVYYL